MPKRGALVMKILKNQNGFSLIEVLVAVTIFAVGLLALAKLQIVSIRGNSSARGVTEASVVAQSKFEELKLLPVSDPALADTDDTGTTGFGVAGLSDTGANADHSEKVTVISGRTYSLDWNVAENADETRLIRMIVGWREAQGQKTFQVDMLYGDFGL